MRGSTDRNQTTTMRRTDQATVGKKLQQQKNPSKPRCQCGMTCKNARALKTHKFKSRCCQGVEHRQRRKTAVETPKDPRIEALLGTLKLNPRSTEFLDEQPLTPRN